METERKREIEIETETERQRQAEIDRGKKESYHSHFSSYISDEG